MSITGNPTHLGHMAAVATAIDHLAEKNIRVSNVKISLSDDNYHQNKVQKSNGKKFALNQKARVHILDETIKEAAKRNMFKGVKVNYWNDQDLGYSDHPDSYRRLVQESKCPVYLVAGKDLCVGMQNWVHSVEHAIVVDRDESHAIENLPKTEHERIFLKSNYPEYEKYSSSAVQEGKIALEPKSLQDYFLHQQLAATIKI
jgi:nicotinic acid mononucleotide adenylyltransferase